MKLQQELGDAHVETAAVLELNSLASVVQCLRAGVGVALVPERAVARELAARQLTRLRWHERLAVRLFFIRHRDKPLGGAYGAFVAAVEQYFAELRANEAHEAHEESERGAAGRCPPTAATGARRSRAAAR